MDKEFYEFAKQLDVMVIFLIIAGSIGCVLGTGVAEILCAVCKACKKFWNRKKAE